MSALNDRDMDKNMIKRDKRTDAENIRERMEEKERERMKKLCELKRKKQKS